MMKKIRLLLADDHPLVLQWLACLLFGRTSGGDGCRQEGPPQGGFSLELLSFWKIREVFFASRTISISALGTMITRDMVLSICYKCTHPTDGSVDNDVHGFGQNAREGQRRPFGLIGPTTRPEGRFFLSMSSPSSLYRMESVGQA